MTRSVPVHNRTDILGGVDLTLRDGARVISQKRPGILLPRSPLLTDLRLTLGGSRIEIVIRSFRDRETEKVFQREFSRRFQSITSTAKRKLDQIHAAAALSDLGAIPGNRLEALSGDRTGQYSIRVNDQWRVCFRWADPDAAEVEIVDYH